MRKGNETVHSQIFHESKSSSVCQMGVVTLHRCQKSDLVDCMRFQYDSIHVGQLTFTRMKHFNSHHEIK